MTGREVCLAHLDKTRPVVVLTREPARAAMSKVTVAPVTTTIRGLSSEVPIGPECGIDHLSVISVDNVLTISTDQLGRTLGQLGMREERLLAGAIVLAYDLDLPLLTS